MWPWGKKKKSEQPMIPVEDVIQGLYALIPSRAPDESEHAEAMTWLKAGKPISGLVNMVVFQAAITERVKDFRAYYGLTEDRLINCGSQFGEVEKLLMLIVNDACPSRMVVDVGACGRVGSNSYDLLKYLRWRGLLIEANPKMAEKVKVEFDGLDCSVECCAVSDYEGEAALTLGLSDRVNSLDAGAVRRWGPTQGEIVVPVKRLETLLKRHSAPLNFDVLSLDVEGHDVRVLNDLIDNTPYRPKWIIVEGPDGGNEKNLDAIGCSPKVVKNYHIVANTIANLVLQRSGADA